MFDKKVHHKDKKGRLYKYTPYRKIDSKTEVYFEQNGMRYHLNGKPYMQSPDNPKSLQSYDVRMETQGNGQRLIYDRIPNDDAPMPGLTKAQSDEVKEAPKPVEPPKPPPPPMAAAPEEPAPIEPKLPDDFVEEPNVEKPKAKRRGRPKKAKSE